MAVPNNKTPNKGPANKAGGPDKAAIQKAFAALDGAYKAAAAEFTPLDGDYICELLDVKAVPRTDEKTGETSLRVVSSWRIAEDDKPGYDMTFRVSHWLVPGDDKAFRNSFFKSFYAVINGEQFDDLQLAFDAATTKIKEMYLIRVKSRSYKAKDGSEKVSTDYYCQGAYQGDVADKDIEEPSEE